MYIKKKYKKGIIAFLYLLNLFKYPLIISINFDGFKQDSNKNLTTIVNVNPEFIQIKVFLDTFTGAAI